MLGRCEDGNDMRGVVGGKHGRDTPNTARKPEVTGKDTNPGRHERHRMTCNGIDMEEGGGAARVARARDGH